MLTRPGDYLWLIWINLRAIAVRASTLPSQSQFTMFSPFRLGASPIPTAIGVIATTFGHASGAIAQSITPAPNDTFTQIEQQGTVFTITGGEPSADSASRFHSFGDFNLNTGETATFLTPPEIQTVLGRVTGGTPSLIDGTIQLLGSQADLYLLNPAGIVFGENAALDVPASFISTSATGAGFEDNGGNVQWFDVWGDSGGEISGMPTLLRFELETPGSMANFAHLAVNEGEEIALISGNILQAGTLTAPAGFIVLVSMENNQVIRFAPVEQFSIGANHPDVNSTVPTPSSSIPSEPIVPMDLPALLTGAEGLYPASQVTVTETGQVVLGGTGGMVVEAPMGSTLVGGTIDVSSDDIQSARFGAVIITGPQVDLINSTIDARAPLSAGLVRIGNEFREQPHQHLTDRVTVDEGSTIDASAILRGNGGIVTVLATEETQLLGPVRVQGGAIAGNGGIFITSENPVPETVTVTSPNGQAGGILDVDSATANNLSVGFIGLFSTFSTISAFEEFDPVFDEIFNQVDIKDPAAVTAAIAALDMESFSPEFMQASEVAVHTLGQLEQILNTTLNPATDFEVRRNEVTDDLSTLLLSKAGTLSTTVDTNPTQLRRELSDRLDDLTAAELVGGLEQLRAAEYGNHWSVTYQVPMVESSVNSIQTVLQSIAQNPGKMAAVIYAFIHGDDLELTLVLPNGLPKRHRFKGVVPSLLTAHKELRWHVTNPLQENTAAYQQPAQDLYRWLLAPFRNTLEQRNVELLLFSLDSGLRSLPVAALHDGQQYLIENYAVAVIPSFGLLETQYQPLTNARVLVAGASRFDVLDDLPSVPVEAAAIGENWQTVSLMEEDFTLDAMQAARGESEFAIAHLATHAVFRDGDPSNSFVQLWGDERLTLDAIASLNFHRPPLELLVLSACQTAFGNAAAELGFAGLSVQSGAKSVVASLWQVSDTGTLALMSEFYGGLSHIPTKAEALRQAQLAMLRNETTMPTQALNRHFQESLVASEVPLSPPPILDLTHPYFWSGFTLVGSPW
ncbi:MAG: CHAT domain-containing protein [Cyanobacteria bacterium P01_F01_bin.153]